MRQLILTGAVAFAAAACSPQGGNDQAAKAPPLPSQPSISVEAKKIGPGMVQMTVHTNLPTPLAAMASLDLDGQKPDDTAIGAAEHETLTGETTTFELATTDDVSHKPLPKGSYTAEVQVGPKWKENASIAALPENIRGQQHIILGEGGSRATLERHNILQKWVILNVGSGDAWDKAKFTRKLGHAEEYASDQSPVLECYYFPDADMTFVVSKPLRKIMVWREGRVSS